MVRVTLRTASAVVQDTRVQKLLGNPVVSNDDLVKLVGRCSPAHSSTAWAETSCKTFAENRRLAYLPEISTLFDELKDEAEGVIDVTVTDDAPLDDSQRETLSAASTPLPVSRQVRLHCETDPSLIGGAVLRAGDLVIDGSVRSRLDRIAYELAA